MPWTCRRPRAVCRFAHLSTVVPVNLARHCWREMRSPSTAVWGGIDRIVQGLIQYAFLIAPCTQPEYHPAYPHGARYVIERMMMRIPRHSALHLE